MQAQQINGFDPSVNSNAAVFLFQDRVGSAQNGTQLMKQKRFEAFMTGNK